MSKKTIVVFVLLSILTLSNVYSEENVITLNPFGNDSEIQLGDNLPNLSTKWEKNFNLTVEPIHAELFVEVADEDDGTPSVLGVYINDELIVKFNIPFYETLHQTVPEGVLVKGTNTIRMETSWVGSGWDDVHIGLVELKYETCYRWTNEGQDTAWDTPDNWDQDEPPSTADAITVFDLSGTNTVTGYGGTIGAMIIQNGTWMFNQGNVLELTESGSNSLDVSGGFLDFYSGSLVTKKAVIGNNAEGQMIMNPNTSWDANGITIGGNAKGELGVFGAVVNDNEINVGGNSEGYLRVIEGAELNVASDLAIGRYSAASIGFMWISGTGTQVTVSDFISIGMVGIGNFVVEDGGYVSAHNIGIGNSLQGYGSLFVKENSQVKTSYYINVNNNGSVLNKGKIDTVQITVRPGGLLVSTGEIDGFVDNQGGIIIGHSPGTLTIEGNYLQESEGFLEIEIGGMTPDSEHDLLHITGNATLGGTLKLFFADGFAPQGGNPSTEDDTFDFIRVTGTINGSFSEVIVQGLEDGFQYDITPEGGTVKLTALSNGVPVCIDEDEDGYPRYAISSCPNSNEADCNDTNPDVNPGATEIPNAIDDDCDGNIDGFRATTTISEECLPDYTDCGNGHCCPPETPVCGEGEDEGLCFEKGGCPVTAIYGEHSEEAKFLRNVRDSVLDNTQEGQELIKLYYQWSPLMVRAIEADEEFKQEIKDIVDEVLGVVE